MVTGFAKNAFNITGLYCLTAVQYLHWKLKPCDIKQVY